MRVKGLVGTLLALCLLTLWFTTPAGAQQAMRLFGTLSGSPIALVADSTGRLRVVNEGGVPSSAYPLTAPAADNCAAVPYSFTSDTNTGVCSPVADSVSLTAGGVNRFVVATEGTLTRSALGETSADGLVLKNATAAAAGAQQMSPRIRFDGFGWKTDATAGSQAVSFINELLPVQGASAPTANLLWKYSVNGGAYSTIATLSSEGIFSGLFIVRSSYFEVPAAGRFQWDASTLLSAPLNGQLNLTNQAASAGVGFDVTTDAILKVRTRAQSAYATIDALGYNLGGVLAISPTAPSAPAACTSPSVLTSNGSFAASVDVGTTCAGISTLVLTFPAAPNGWECGARHITTPASFLTSQSASTTTSVTITNYSRTTGLATDWVDGNDVGIGPCAPR